MNFKNKCISLSFILSIFILLQNVSYSQAIYLNEDNLSFLQNDSASDNQKNNILLRKEGEDSKNRSKSPTTAMILSAVLPGGGQFYNESYWKIPIILGLGGYWGYEFVQMNKNYTDYKNLFSASITKSLPSGNYQYKTIRDFYRGERDKFAWYLGILYVANIIDAYVDASLFQFSVSDDLSQDNVGGNIYSVKLTIYF